ncbi:hypothetical protein [Nocardia tengchongensis]
MEESREAAEEFLDGILEFLDQRDRAAFALGLLLPLEIEVLQRLRDRSIQSRMDYVLIASPIRRERVYQSPLVPP